MTKILLSLSFTYFQQQSINKFLILNNPLAFTEIAFDLSCETDCVKGIMGEGKESQITNLFVNKVS